MKVSGKMFELFPVWNVGVRRGEHHPELCSAHKDLFWSVVFVKLPVLCRRGLA